MYTTFGTYSFYMTVCCPGWIGTGTTDSHLKRIISFVRTVVPPDDEHR
jgi:hypothetical protein